MFEKIGRYAETVATNANLSRRGFLGRLGQAALGVAGLVGALLVLPGQARAPTGYCDYHCPDGSSKIIRECGCQLSIKHGGMTCPLFYNGCPYT